MKEEKNASLIAGIIILVIILLVSTMVNISLIIENNGLRDNIKTLEQTIKQESIITDNSVIYDSEEIFEFFYNNTWYRVKLENGAPIEVITTYREVEPQGLSFILTEVSGNQIYDPVTVTFFRAKDGLFDLVNSESVSDTIYPQYYTNNMYVQEGDEFIIRMDSNHFYPVWYYCKISHGNPVVYLGIDDLIKQEYTTLNGETRYLYSVDISDNEKVSSVSLIRKGDIFSRWSFGELKIKFMG